MCPTTVTPKVSANGTARRIDVASIRREQIVEAAVAIIVEKGLHNLSLSKIEKRTGMKRGQLTYYFPAKEDILLAVFDRLLQVLHERLDDRPFPPKETIGIPSAWDIICERLPMILSPECIGGEFHALQFTFLAQIAHRKDYRDKLASLYGEWRNGMAAHWKVTAKPAVELANNVSPRTISSFIQALFHGLGMQLAADPEAFDRKEMLEFCLVFLAPLFVSRTETKEKSTARAAHRNGKPTATKEK